MFSASRKKRKLLEHHRVSEMFSVVAYDEETKTFLHDDNTMGVFIVMRPTNGISHETENALDNFFKEKFPKNTAIQWSLVSSPDIENLLFGYQDIRKDRGSEPNRAKLNEMSDEIHRFVREGSEGTLNQAGYRYRNYEVWLSIRVPHKSLQPTVAEMKEFDKLVKNCQAKLRPFSPHLGSDYDLKRRMTVMLNMYGGKPSWKGKPQGGLDPCHRTGELRELFLDRGRSIEPKRDGIQFYDENDEPCMFARSMSMASMPDAFSYGSVNRLIGDMLQGSININEHYIMTLQIWVPNQKKIEERIKKKFDFVNMQFNAVNARMMNTLRGQRNDYQTVIRELDDGYNVVKYNFQVVSFCRDKKQSEDFFQTLQGWYSASRFDLQTDYNFSLPFILSALPFGLDEGFVEASHRFEMATTKALRYLAPHVGGWAGNTIRPMMILGDKLGQAVGLDFFASKTNKNIYISGTSGSGKSFFVNAIVDAMLAVGRERRSENPEKIMKDDGGQVFIVDVGGSYKKLCQIYPDSQYLQFDETFNYSLNPFVSVKDIDEIGVLPMLRSIIQVMASPSGDLDDEQNAELIKVIKQVWDAKGRNSSIDDVIDVLMNWDLEKMHSIGRQLEPFSSRSVYGKFFDPSKPLVSFNSRLFVCELEELKGDAHLQIVVLMSMVMSIQRKIYMAKEEGDKRRKMFILDEAWEFMKDHEGGMLEYFSKFIEEGWRRFRKYGASGVMATQSVNDSNSSAVGKAVMANSAWTLLLNQKPSEISRLEQDNFFGDESAPKMLKHIHTLPPNPKVTDESYSDVLVMVDGMTQPCRLYTSRKIQLINTTDDDEKQLIDRYISKGLALEDAIDTIIREEEKVRRGHRSAA